MWDKFKILEYSIPDQYNNGFLLIIEITVLLILQKITKLNFHLKYIRTPIQILN